MTDTNVDVRTYAPRRVRIVDSAEAPMPSAPPMMEEALTAEIRSNAERMSVLVGNIQEREKRANQENSDLKARLEQHGSRITELMSQIETMRLKYETEHTERVRLRSVFESIGGLVADGLHSS